ncbi:MAG: carboxypeptidase regulatory-like domain-containing protein [Acidobacteria bacterium]|nr:carboxypeptidase regulatory-like domain-containing protein [Acidobacteriota bacterium]
MKSLTMAVALALALLARGPLEAGELRGRAFLDEKPAPKVTLTAVPLETVHEAARREARGGAEAAALATAVTGADGAGVLVPKGREGLVEVRVGGPGVVAHTLSGAWDANESDDLPEMTLARSRSLSGRVVDAAGAAVEDAEVELLPQVAESAGRAVPQRTKTAANGTFRFDGASAAGNAISVSKPGHAPVRLLAQRAGTLARPLALGVPVTLSGTVVLPSKKPAAGALVRFEGAGVTRWVEADAEGAFRIADAPKGAGHVIATAGPEGAARIALALPRTAEAPLVVELEATGTLEGRVVDAETLSPIPGVRIETRSSRGDSSVVKTGKDGTYRLRGLSEDRYRVLADEPRYARAMKVSVAVEGGAVRRFDLVLRRGVTVAGRVVDENGLGVGGARGTVGRPGIASLAALSSLAARLESGDSLLRTFRSAADGTFRLTRIHPGDDQSLFVSLPGTERFRRDGLSLAPGQTLTGLVVVLRRGVTLEGTVVDPAGTPLSGTAVSLSTEDPARRGLRIPLRKVETDGAGRFEMRGLSEGSYEVTMSRTGSAVPEPVKVVLSSATPPEPLRVVLEPGGSIAGFVRTKSGEPLEGVVVFARRARGAAGRAVPASVSSPPTDSGGGFLIEGLRLAEAYDLAMFEPGEMTRTAPQTLRTLEAPAENVLLEGESRGRIRGLAVDLETGRPIGEFTVLRQNEQFVTGAFPGAYRPPEAGSRVEVSGADGAFELTGVPPGTWRVVVEAKGYQNGRAGGVVVSGDAPGEPLIVKLAKGRSIEGRVTDAKTGRPVPEAYVSARPAAGDSGGAAFFGHGGELIVSDAEGRFEIPGLSPGAYTVSARHADYAALSEQAEVREGAVAPIVLKLSAGLTAAGTVVSKEGRPIPGAEVSLDASGGRGGGGSRAVSDAEGRFRFRNLSPGRYALRATVKGRASAPLEAVLEAQSSREDLTIPVDAGATLRVTVRGLRASEKRAYVSVIVGSRQHESAFTGPDGSLEILGLPPGRADVMAIAGGGDGEPSRRAFQSIEIAEGAREAELTLTLEEGHTLSGRVLRGGRGVAGASVSAGNRAGSGGSGGGASTNASGDYRIEGLPRGSYTVSVWLDSGTRSKKITLSGDDRLDFEFGSARIAGSVVEEGSLRPLADASVEVRPVDAAEDATGPRMPNPTDTSGRFGIDGLDPVAHRVTVRKPGFAVETKDVRAEEGGASVAFELRRVDGIGLRARDGIYGLPLGSVYLQATSSAGAPGSLSGPAGPPGFTGNVLLDSDGRGTVPSLSPGRYDLVLRAAGFAPAQLRGVSVPSSEIEVAFTPGGTLEVRPGPETEARLAAGGRVLLFGADGRPYSGSLTGQIYVRPPVVRVENLAPGSYVLRVEGGTERTLVVKEGGTTPVVLP